MPTPTIPIGHVRLTGRDAIERAKERDVTLSKFADPTDGAREGLTVEEAIEVAKEDPSLIYLDTAAGPLYLVEVRGAHASPARIGTHGDAIHAHTSGRTDWCAATVWEHAGERAPYWTITGAEKRRVALFTSQRAAEMAVMAGELWNGQAYRIRAARGEQLRQGVVIRSYQAPHRPPRSPAGARVKISVRVAPETAARWESERAALGLGLGEYLDQVGQRPTKTPRV